MAKAKQLTEMDCDGSVYAATTVAVSARLEEMCAFRNAALDGSDPEGVHNMRVAARRLRSALRDFKPYLAKRRFSKYRKDLRHIAQALGRVRDCDVAIIELERIAEKAPADIAGGIRRFAQLRHARREEARVELMTELNSEFLLDSKEQFTKTSKPGSRSKTKMSANQTTKITFREVGRSIILDYLDELEKLSRSLYYPSKTKPLHEMRIAAKRLRYALELFEQCWGQPLGFFAKKVAGLQSSLGEIHDCDVWIADFGETATHGQPALDFDHKATLVWLISHFVKRRSKHLGKALSQWHEWESEGFSARLRGTNAAHRQTYRRSWLAPKGLMVCRRQS